MTQQHDSERVPDDFQMWTIYDHPRDYPAGFVARRHVIKPGGLIVFDEHAKYAHTLREIRRKIPRGLVCISRNASDDPVIVETWL